MSTNVISIVHTQSISDEIMKDKHYQFEFGKVSAEMIVVYQQ